MLLVLNTYIEFNEKTLSIMKRPRVYAFCLHQKNPRKRYEIHLSRTKVERYGVNQTIQYRINDMNNGLKSSSKKEEVLAIQSHIVLMNEDCHNELTESQEALPF